MQNPSEIERLDGLSQLAARDALQVRVREHTCPPLLDHGPNQLWPEVQTLTARVAELESQLATANALIEDWKREATRPRKFALPVMRISRIPSPPYSSIDDDGA